MGDARRDGRCLIDQVGHPGRPAEPWAAAETERGPAGVYLLWLPLGAGGVGFVRLNGRIYEGIKARREGRRPLDLYHAALEVRVPEGRFVVENAWPSPDADTAARGVVFEGPVFSHRFGRFRPFRYEVRSWLDGVIADAGEAAAVHLVSDDARRARRLLDLVAGVPPMIWGRDELGAGEMWNSNSVISYLLAGSGLPARRCQPPAGGRAPGWEAGIAMAIRRLGADADAPMTQRGSR